MAGPGADRPMSIWVEQISPERRDELVDALARKIANKGLGMPAVLFLEMHRPLSFLMGQSLWFAMPFLGALMEPRLVAEYSRLLESPDSVDRLIERIEELSEHPQQPPTRAEGR